MTLFNINYQRAYTSSIEFQTQLTEKMQGREQRYPRWTYPKRVFTLKFDKDPEARSQIEAFFDSMQGNVGIFDWVWETDRGGNGQTYQCTFEMESLEQNLHHLGFSECELKLVTIDRFPVTPPASFDFYYKTEYKFSRAFSNLIDKVFTAQDNRRALLTEPKKTWTLVFDKEPITRKMLEDFFISKRGKFKNFQWTWEESKGGDGQTYTVRFDTDTLTSELFYGYSDNITLPIKEVWPTSPAPTDEYAKDEIIPRRLIKIDLDTGPVRILDNETLEALTYNEEDYIGAPLEVSEIVQNDNTEVTKITVGVSNVGQAISAIIGSYGDVITNSDVTLYEVLLNVSTNEIIADSDRLRFSGKANNLHLDSLMATMDVELSLGGYDMKAPKMSYGVNCQWLKFKDIRCGYTGVEKTCDRTLTTCKRYGNIERFGGFPSIPSEQIIRA